MEHSLKMGCNAISNPWIHIYFAIAAEIGLTIDTLYFYYGYASVSPEILSPDFTDTFNTPIMNTLQIWKVCTGCILVVDLLLDVIAQYLERRAFGRRGHDDVTVITSARDSTRKAVRSENEKVTREHVSRFIFIISVVIPAVVNWASPVNSFRGVLAYFSSRFTMISIFCVENFVIMNTFRGTYDWQCFCMSAGYAISGTIAMHCRLAGHMQNSHSLRVFLLVAQLLPVLWNTILNVFLLIRMFLARRKREAGVNQWSCTASEWMFIIYSSAGIAVTLLIVIVCGSSGFTLTTTTALDLVIREAVIIVLATAIALLPARIARIRANIAENTLTNAKRGVNDLLRSPLKVACTELDELLSGDTLSIDHSRRIAKVALACNNTFEKLTCIAEVTTEYDNDEESQHADVAPSNLEIVQDLAYRNDAIRDLESCGWVRFEKADSAASFQGGEASIRAPSALVSEGGGEVSAVSADQHYSAVTSHAQQSVSSMTASWQGREGAMVLARLALGRRQPAVEAKATECFF